MKIIASDFDNTIYFLDDNEKNKKNDNKQILQKIREGIKNGTIVKEYKPDGTYIWKKVRK